MTQHVEHAAQIAANISGKEQIIYQRPTGEYIICAKGLESLLPENIRATLKHIQTIQPDYSK